MPENEVLPSNNAPSAVWPPPPVGAPTTQLERRGYVPLRKLSGAISGCLTAYCVFAVLALVGQCFTGQLRTNILHIVMDAVGMVNLVTSIVFLIWVYRTNVNVRAFGAMGLSNSPGWAVGYFFIPIINLFRPFQAIREVWQASDPDPRSRDGQAWQLIRTPAFLGWWWAWWITLWVLVDIRVHTATDNAALPIENTVGIISAILAILVVRRLTARQEETARTLSLTF